MGSDRFGNSRTRIVKRDGLYTHARRISPKLKNETEAAFGRYIRKQGAVDAWVSRRRGWQFPSLAECRKRWLERFPQTQWRDVAVKNWRVEDE